MIVTLEKQKTGDGLMARHPNTRKVGFPARGTRIPAGATPGARWAVEEVSETERVWFFRLVEPEETYLGRLLREKEEAKRAEEQRSIAALREALPAWEALLTQYPQEEELATTVTLIRQVVAANKRPAGVIADRFTANGPYMNTVVARAKANARLREAAQSIGRALTSDPWEHEEPEAVEAPVSVSDTSEEALMAYVRAHAAAYRYERWERREIISESARLVKGIWMISLLAGDRPLPPEYPYGVRGTIYNEGD